MKKTTMLLLFWCLGLLFATSTCFSQMYTVMDLGDGSGLGSTAYAVNNQGQVVGYARVPDCYYNIQAFRTAPNSPINPATDYLNCGVSSWAYDINDSGQVVGGIELATLDQAFRTAPNSPIYLTTDDLGTLGVGNHCYLMDDAFGINASGQVVGTAFLPCYGSDPYYRAFHTAANSSINPAADDLGTLGGQIATGHGINDSGQAVGSSSISGDSPQHAFRTASNSPINLTTDDLGTLGGTNSFGNAINAFGRVAGASQTAGDAAVHAFRTAPNSAINPNTDDLGTLGGEYSVARAIDDYGQVVGSSLTQNSVDRAFVYSNGVMRDLNDLIPPVSGCGVLEEAVDINAAGQIAANNGCEHAVLLTPIYKALVQPPLNPDSTNVFHAKRGVLPVKFTLAQYGAPTCTLLPATIAVTRIAGELLGSIDENTYLTNANDGSNFRMTACQYVYNLPASALGAGGYRVDISINGVFVGHAVFTLK